jgi:long-chain acyl-CoA synthetase
MFRPVANGYLSSVTTLEGKLSMSATVDRGATAEQSGTIAGLAAKAATRQGAAVRHKEGGRWVDVSYGELGKKVTALAKGLLALGVEPGDRVAILAQTRPEWTYADLAILSIGAVAVPVYQTNSPGECHYVLEHSGSTVLFCEDAEQLDKISEIRDRLPELQHLIAFTDGDGRDGVLTMDDLESRGSDTADDAVRQRSEAVSPDDLATIVYTSGTTGPPKGCMLTHGNLASDIAMVAKRFDFGPGDVYYVFLPLAHVLTRAVQFIALDAGSTLAYWQRDPKKLVEEVAEIRPTHLPSVPRLFEKIYTAASSKTAEAGGVKEKLFHWAVNTGRKVREIERDGGTPNPVLKAQHALADKLVLGKIRDLFGGQVKVALTGAAPIDKDILSFFHAAGVWVLEGYGMTETSAVATVNTVEEHKLGTVGKPLPGCEVKIAEDGEVLMKGPNIFKGYFKNEEATNSDLRDGWLHSGDLGELDSEGYLSITGRKKDLIITSSGKNITPSNIENALRQNRWISQAIVYGDRKPYLVAMLTLDPEEAPALAKKVGASSDDPASLAEHDGVREELQKVVDEANRQFARIEQVKKFTILDRDLSQEDEELTPTLKVKRNVVYERHDERFQGLYDG